MLVFLVGYYHYSNSVNGFDDGQKVSLFIDYGTPVNKIADKLQEKGIIKSTWPFLLYLKLEGKHNELQAGDFILKRGSSYFELTNSLSNAKAKEIPLRIIEGYTIEDIDALLAKKGLIEKGEFTKCAQTCKFPKQNFVYDGNLEGYLFPDTYFTKTDNFDIEHFIRRMLNNFEIRFLSAENKAKYRSQKRSLQQIVIMASIIEREETNINNMPIISGILWKRLDEKIPLGADATTRYFERNKSGALTTADFQKDNKYNTRKYLGLPPTAISNPGINALKAALNPEESKYYYYLHDNSGNIHLSETNDEHNQKKYKYLR